MATLLLHEAGSVRAFPLPATLLVGRSAGCFVRVAHEACPAHWLELRWRADAWAWRALAALDRTYGAGAFLADGWRTLDAREGQGTRIRLTGTHVVVELVDAGPPEPFVYDLTADEAVEGEALSELVEVRGDALLPLWAEGDPAAALADGACWVHREGATERILRAHVPTPVVATLAPRLDLASAGAALEVDLGAMTAVFHQRDAVATVRGECVRVLAVFLQARLEGEGWIDASEAWTRWVELGGRGSARLERMSWERGKLRQQLARQGCGALETLFEHRKVGGFVRTRLALEPGQLHLKH